MDYSQYLVLYSGGEDSTYFIESQSTARHLIHYCTFNEYATKVAVVNANILNRSLVLVPDSGVRTGGNESNRFHSLIDAYLALDAGMRAVQHGMRGIAICFNADDSGFATEALERIFKDVEPAFEILLPLRGMSSRSIREARITSKLKAASCMIDEHCGFCPKCAEQAQSR